MNIIPLIEINNKKIQNSELLEKLNEDDLVYVIDIDGIKKNNSNLDIYQKLSKKYQLDIDSAPRTFGDVVDVFMAGAKNITLRKTYYPHIKLESIREITENKIYANIEIYNQTEFYDDFFFEGVDGLINFYSREELEHDFKKLEVIKNISIKNKMYIYENNKQNIEYWNKFNPECFLVDISNYWEFKQI
ncbi:MAG: hypothetical protein MUO82_01200 [Candidatus Thermoplasmatota archaeon]|nr:hypothetical protein [Candidatus Thermoplasmatota archaeon]